MWKHVLVCLLQLTSLLGRTVLLEDNISNKYDDMEMEGVEEMPSVTTDLPQIPRISKVVYARNMSELLKYPVPSEAPSPRRESEMPRVPEVPKCCPLGESLVRNELNRKITCEKTQLPFDPVFWRSGNQTPPSEVDLLIGERCKDDSYRLEPHKDSQDEFHLLSNGFLHVPYQSDNLISPYDYCLETFELEDGKVEVLPLICFPPQPPPDPWKEIAMVLYPIGCLISVPFLLATFVIYLMFPELRVLQGKVLCCYSLCLAFAYFCLAVVQIWGENMENNLCVIIAFSIQFFFVACFFWLNVMCFHTWRKMRNETLGKKGKVNEKQRFFIYSLYGWGFPLLILAVSLIMDLTPTIPPSYIKPNVGIETCWFQSDSATLSYFYGPISILLCINVVFFLLTIKYLHMNPYKGKLTNIQDVAKQLMINKRRQLFIQSLLLFCAMGLNWILEVLSWKYGHPAEFWTFVDSFNTLQGVVVFVVFVVRDDLVCSLICQRWKRSRQEASSEASTPLNSP